MNAPRGCPSRASIAARATSLLPAKRPTQRVAAEITIVNDGKKGMVARLLMETPNGSAERVVHGESCESVAEAMALVLSMAASPSNDEPARELPPAPPPPVSAPPPPSEPAPAPSAPSASSAWSRSARALGGVAVGVVPAPAPAVDLAFGVRRARFGADVVLGAVTAVNGGSPQDGIGGSFEKQALGLRGCAVALSTTHVNATACLGAALERFVARGAGSTRTFESERLRGALTASASVAPRPTGWLSLPLEVTALTPLDRPNYVVYNVGGVYRPSPVGVTFQVGVELSF